MKLLIKNVMFFYFAIRCDIYFIIFNRIKITIKLYKSKFVDCEQIENLQFLFDNKRSIKIYKKSNNFVAINDLNFDINFY